MALLLWPLPQVCALNISLKEIGSLDLYFVLYIISLLGGLVLYGAHFTRKNLQNKLKFFEILGSYWF